MLDMRSKKLLGTLILAGVVAVTLVMAPYTLVDPINLPKLSGLTFFAIVAASLTIPSFRKIITSDFRILAIISILFVVQLILVLFFSGSNIGQQFFGVYGRNTGVLAYLTLLLMLFASSQISNEMYLKRFIGMSFVSGLVLILYGQVQYFGLEPFPFVNAYSVRSPIGTLGNPDFMSAFMGLMAVIGFTMALNMAFSFLVRSCLALLGLLSIITILETHAKQGQLNFVAGIGVVCVLWLFMTKRFLFGKIVCAVGVFGGGLVFLGLINAGPLASFIYKESLAARGFYWRAALEMLISHPFFGVGMDGFGDWYRRARSASYVESEFLTVSDTAHNVFLDIASNGGFPLLGLYLAILGLVIVSIFRVVKRSQGFDVYFAAIVGAWVAYQAQSFVSINQLGLAIWGWVLSGLIIGYEINTKASEAGEQGLNKQKHKGRVGKVVTSPLSSATVASLFTGVLIASFVALPPYIAAAKYYKALQSGDANVIQAAAYLQPLERTRFLQAAITLRDNKLEGRAIMVLRDATKIYPDFYELWQIWANIPTAAPAEIANANTQLKRLDPQNPDLK